MLMFFSAAIVTSALLYFIERKIESMDLSMDCSIVEEDTSSEEEEEEELLDGKVEAISDAEEDSEEEKLLLLDESPTKKKNSVEERDDELVHPLFITVMIHSKLLPLVSAVIDKINSSVLILISQLFSPCIA